MPLKIEKLTPHVAFAVTYEGKIIPIFYYYEDDNADNIIDGWYTADIKEGVRDFQPEKHCHCCYGLLGEHGYTAGEERQDWYFSTHALFKDMRSLPEFQDEQKKHSFQWEPSFILQTAINNGLIGFDEDYRVVETMMIEEPVKSFTGQVIYPYDMKEGS